jgi:transcriptional regulator with XRE-family HTH domain
MSQIDFRDLIRRRLKSFKMSVPELARRIGKNHQTIYNYLSKRTSMRDDTLAAIFSELQIKIQTN